MKLKDYVDRSIHNYPPLYRSFDYASSRTLVLSHTFLSYGTGLEWHPDGFLADHITGKYNIVKPCRLPKNYFDCELWELSIFKKDLPKIKKALKGHYNYTRPRCLRGDISLIFEADKELADKLALKFMAEDEDYKRMKRELKKLGVDRFPIAHEAVSYVRGHTKEGYIHEPTVMCKYSPIVEMTGKRTNSPRIDNFDLKKIQPDWIEGAIEIVHYALDFYKDPEKNKHCYLHPNKSLWNFKKAYEKDPNCYRTKGWGDEGMKPNQTVEEFCEERWLKAKDEQIVYCESFLKMYEKRSK